MQPQATCKPMGGVRKEVHLNGAAAQGSLLLHLKLNVRRKRWVATGQ